MSRIAFLACVDYGAVARPLGRLATLLGGYDDAETHLRDALALHQRMHAPYWIARTQLDLAELCVSRQSPASLSRRSGRSTNTAMAGSSRRRSGYCIG